jgi:hypothetical protein
MTPDTPAPGLSYQASKRQKAKSLAKSANTFTILSSAMLGLLPFVICPFPFRFRARLPAIIEHAKGMLRTYDISAEAAFSAFEGQCGQRAPVLLLMM